MCSWWVHAGYDYVIEEGRYGLPSLEDYETLLMTGGGGDSLNLDDHSLARVEGTSPLEEGYGGIWHLNVYGEAHLEFLGGEVHQLDLGTYGTAVLSGGRIDRLSSRQNAWKSRTAASCTSCRIRHITIVLRFAFRGSNTQTNILTGNWLNGTAFNIPTYRRGGVQSRN